MGSLPGVTTSSIGCCTNDRHPIRSLRVYEESIAETTGTRHTHQGKKTKDKVEFMYVLRNHNYTTYISQTTHSLSKSTLFVLIQEVINTRKILVAISMLTHESVYLMSRSSKRYSRFHFFRSTWICLVS